MDQKDRKENANDAESEKAYIVDEASDEAVMPEHDEIREHIDESYETHVDPKGPRRPVPSLTGREANTDRDRYRTSEDDKADED